MGEAPSSGPSCGAVVGEGVGLCCAHLRPALALGPFSVPPSFLVQVLQLTHPPRSLCCRPGSQGQQEAQGCPVLCQAFPAPLTSLPPVPCPSPLGPLPPSVPPPPSLPLSNHCPSPPLSPPHLCSLPISAPPSPPCLYPHLCPVPHPCPHLCLPPHFCPSPSLAFLCRCPLTHPSPLSPTTIYVLPTSVPFPILVPFPSSLSPPLCWLELGIHSNSCCCGSWRLLPHPVGRYFWHCREIVFYLWC